jgi:hypothetical protein
VPHQRAEEEKKKAEADRVQKELERQRVLQQQLQAQYSMHSMFNVASPMPPGAGAGAAGAAGGAAGSVSASGAAGSSAPPSSFSQQQQQMPGTFAISQQPAGVGVRVAGGGGSGAGANAVGGSGSGAVVPSQTLVPPQSGAMGRMGAASFPLMSAQGQGQGQRQGQGQGQGMPSQSAAVPSVQQQQQQQPTFSRTGSGSGSGSGVRAGSVGAPSFGMPAQPYPPLKQQQQSPPQIASAVHPSSHALLPNSTNMMPPGLSLSNVHNKISLSNNLQNNSTANPATSNSNMMLGGFASTISPTITSDSAMPMQQQQQQHHHSVSSLHNTDLTHPPAATRSSSSNSQPASMFGMENRQYPPSSGVGYDGASSTLDADSEMRRMSFMGNLSGGDRNSSNSVLRSMPDEEEYVDGGLNLSAVARPFVPQFSSSPSMSPPQHLSAGGQLGPGGSESLSLPPLGSQSYTPGHGHDWHVDVSGGGGGGGGGNTATGTGFLWQQGGGVSSTEVDTNKGNANAHDDDSEFDMMAMNVPMDLLGGLDDLLQPPPAGGSSLLDGLVSSGGGGTGGSGGGGLNQQQTSTSRFLNLGREDAREDNTGGGDFFPGNHNNSTNILSSSLNDFMTNMGEHHDDFSTNNDNIQSVFSSSNSNR